MTQRTASLLAVVILLLTGVAFKAVAYTPAVLERQPLATFPLQVGAWTGRTAFFNPEMVAAVHADDYLLRSYSRQGGVPLWFYVAYYGSQPPDSRIHSPAVCLPGAGWSIAQAGIVSIPIGDRSITVNRNVIQKGDARQVVLYWYQIHRKVVARELPAMATLAWTALTLRRGDEALVRINAPIAGSVVATERQEAAFLQAAFPELGRLLP